MAGELTRELTDQMNKLLDAETKTRDFGSVLERAKYDSKSQFYRFFLDWKQRTHFSFLHEMLEKVNDNADRMHDGYRRAKMLLDDLQFESARPGFSVNDWVSRHGQELGRVQHDVASIVHDHEAWAKQVAMDKLRSLTNPTAEIDVAPHSLPGDLGFMGGAFAFAIPAVTTALATIVSFDMLKRFVGAHDPQSMLTGVPFGYTSAGGPAAYVFGQQFRQGPQTPVPQQTLRGHGPYNGPSYLS